MTTLDGGTGSLLPPSKRDLVTTEDLVRAHDRNLRALSRGFGSGRMIQARLVTDPSQAEDAIGDGGGDDADDTDFVWEWDDRFTVVTGGGADQLAVLSGIPVDESLFVRWHPDGGGGLPILNESFTLVDNQVTISDPDGIFVTGDEFSFQYQTDPGQIAAPSPLEAFTLRGVASSSGAPPALPGGAVIGDFIVVVCCDASPPSSTDPRLTVVSNTSPVGSMWIGNLSSLSALSFSGTASHWAIAVYEGSAQASGAPSTVTGTTSGTLALPVLPGNVAVVGSWQTTSVVPGIVGYDSPYIEDIHTTGIPNHNQVGIGHWIDNDETSTPNVNGTFSGGLTHTGACVVSLESPT